jgi:G:T/U-mismatch repair DNA glycosylase
VVGYLRKALRNERVTQLRRLRRDVPLEESGALEGDAAPSWELLGEDDHEPEQRRLVEQAVARLFEAVVPQAAARMKAPFGESFLEAIRVRREIARGATTYAKTVAGEPSKQARDRFDQQQSRAMKRLFEAVEAFEAEQVLPSHEAQALRGVFRALKHLELQWPPSGDVTS